MSSETTHRRKRRLIWAIAGIAFIAAVLTVVLSFPRESPEKLVWMTPAQMTQTLKQGRWTLLKYKIMRWPGPWRWFTSHKRQISIETRVLNIPHGATLPIPQSELCHTNAKGEVAW